MTAPPGDTFMMTFEFEAFEGHIVAHIDGNDCLVDTGSPLTKVRLLYRPTHSITDLLVLAK